MWRYDLHIYPQIKLSGFIHYGRSVLSDRVFKYSAEDVSSVFRQFPYCRCFSDHKLSVELPWDQFDITAICFVRDPVERFLSHYFYTRQESKTCFDV